MKGNNDHAPSRCAAKNCEDFLLSELTAAKPQRVMALGAVAFSSLCDIFHIDAPRKVAEFRGKVWWVRLGGTEVPLTGTYFTGNNRHKGFDKIVEDINQLLHIEPRIAGA
jgi:uracil-DNA glycosylase family 4